MSDTSHLTTESGSYIRFPDGQGLLGLFLVVTATLSASGFFIVHSYLGTYTTISSLKIVPTLYLAAGISLVGMIVFTVIIWYVLLIFLQNWRRVNIQKYLLGRQALLDSSFESEMILLGAFILIYLFVFSTIDILRKNDIMLLVFIAFFFALAFLLGATTFVRLLFLADKNLADKTKIIVSSKPVYELSSKGKNAILVVYFSVMLALLAGLYGRVVYGLIPRELGGGRPSTIRIAFKGQNSAISLGLQLDMDKKSQAVCLLAELVDGILIYHPNLRRVSIIPTGSESEIAGYFDSYDENIDCSPP